MADPLIESGAVEVWLGTSLVAPEDAQVEAMIGYASARLRRLVPNLDARVGQWNNQPGAAGGLDPALVEGAMVSSVLRALDIVRRGGRDVRSEEYPEVKTTYAEMTQTELRAAVYFTDEELADLLIGGGRAPLPRWSFC